jgi:ferritin-like metal-binding protein YciE
VIQSFAKGRLLLLLRIETTTNLMADKELIQEKIGEAIGLEKAAQKAVEELDSRGLLKPEHMKKLSKMKEEAGKQETEMEKIVQELTESDEIDSDQVESTAEETAGKASKIMETYLGEDPDTQEVLEFLCLAEGGEVTHYEVLTAVAKELKNKKFGTTVRRILKEEQGHLELCTKLAKSNASG